MLTYFGDQQAPNSIILLALMPYSLQLLVNLILLISLITVDSSYQILSIFVEKQKSPNIEQDQEERNITKKRFRFLQKVILDSSLNPEDLKIWAEEFNNIRSAYYCLSLAIIIATLFWSQYDSAIFVFFAALSVFLVTRYRKQRTQYVLDHLEDLIRNASDNPSQAPEKNQVV
jgi:membrane protein implicated in regulation of membrane protease activity